MPRFIVWQVIKRLNNKKLMIEKYLDAKMGDKLLDAIPLDYMVGVI